MILDGYQRMNLVHEIALKLQQEMTTRQINQFLANYKIQGKASRVDSKRVYVEELLQDADNSTILRIADDLGLEIPYRGTIKSVYTLQTLLDGSAYYFAKRDFEQALADIETRPDNAICLACTTLESIYKAILDAFGESYPSKQDVQSLQKAVFQKMKLSPNGYADEDIKRVLGGLINVGAGLGAMRTKYSSCHGKGTSGKQYRLESRHARLAVNALTTIGLFILETYEERFAAQNQSPSQQQ